MSETSYVPLVDDDIEVKRKYFQEMCFSRYFPHSGIGYRYSNAFLNNFKLQDKWQIKLKKFLDKYIEETVSSFESEREDIKWLIFLGNKGVGKTHAACTIANELMRNNIQAKYTSLPRLLADIKSSYGKGGNHLDSFIDVPFLVIDEVGSAPLSSDDYRNLFIIIDERYMEQNPTILISNAKDLSFLGGAIIDRLTECSKTITFETVSYRSGKNI